MMELNTWPLLTPVYCLRLLRWNIIRLLVGRARGSTHNVILLRCTSDLAPTPAERAAYCGLIVADAVS